jgi:uncharacterized protein (TIGR03067 family)
MKRHLPLLLAAGLALAAGSPPGNAAKNELKKLEGTWKVVAVEVNGQAVPAAARRLETITIKGARLTVVEQGNKESSMGLKIDPKKKPRAMDLHITRGGTSVDWKCIYALKDNELKICMPLPQKKGDNTPDAAGLGMRPDDFATEGRRRMLVTATRQAGKGQR